MRVNVVIGYSNKMKAPFIRGFHFSNLTVCYSVGGLPFKALTRSEIAKSTKNTKKQIFANPTEAPAMPPKPNTPAMSAITKNVIAKFNILYSPVYLSADSD